MERLRRPSRVTVVTWLSLLGALSLAGVGCWRGNLPSVVSSDPPVTDAATAAQPPPTGGEDAAQIILSARLDGSAACDAGTGTVALTVGLPVDPRTGQFPRIGSLLVRLHTTDGSWSGSFSVEIAAPLDAVSLNFGDVPAGGQYQLDVSATPDATGPCAGSSPTFAVVSDQTIGVFEALICGGDAGLAPTLSTGNQTP